MKTATDLIQNIEQQKSEDADLQKVLEALKAKQMTLQQLQPGLELVLRQGPKLRLVKNPIRSEYPPISNDSMVNFGNALGAIEANSNLEEYLD